MPVTEVIRAVGSWELQLSDETPQVVWDGIGYYGHVVIHAGPVEVNVAGDSLLSSARYVGVLRKKDHAEGFSIGGGGMAMWLGDEDGKGSVIESSLSIVAKTLEESARLILPPASSAILEGSYFALPGNPTLTHTFQWVTQREALNYLSDTLGAEWKVLGTGHLHMGPEGSLFVVNPKTVVTRRDQGTDLTLRAFSGNVATEQKIDDFTTRVVLLATDDNGSVATAAADINPVLNPYKDLHGATIKMTRLIGESSTDFTNAPARAQLQLNRFSGTSDSLTLSTQDYDVKGNVEVGDYVWIYDPEHGLIDAVSEIIFRGQRLNPMKLRLKETTWPVTRGMHVAFRDRDGKWMDLTPHVEWETGDTTLVVGGFFRRLGDGSDGGGGLTPRPNPQPNTTIPNAPTWVTPFLQGVYQSPLNGSTKAQTQLQWNQPTNTDTTAITDGDYYEIRYRTSTAPLFPVTHAQMAVLTHAQLAANGGTWGQPIQYAVGEWQYARVPFSELKTVLYELTPTMPYEAQIRVVDNGTPANAGAWSTLTAWQATDDTLGPSTPASPEVSASLIAVQVVHRLGKSSGGTFNLEPDLHHLEVHAEYEPGFTPSENTRIGRMIANRGMMVAQIPVVGTFQISDVTPTYFKVVAVDDAGNKSGPSSAASATPNLVDDAHISNLTVSKLLAGTLSANVIMGSYLRMGPGTPGSGSGGPAVELTPFGLQAFGEAGVTWNTDSATGNMQVLGTGGLQITGGGNVEVTDGALIIYNASGQKILEIGECADGRHGMQVYTDAGVRTARVGELAAGGHGIEVIDEANGNLVKISTLAFGTKGATVTAAQNIGSNTGGAFVDLATVGPTASNVVIGNSGRCVVLITCGINALSSGGYNAGFAISGATTVAADVARSVALTGNINFLPSETIGGGWIVTGLNSGTHTITVKYASTGSSALFFNRTLVVIPF